MGLASRHIVVSFTLRSFVLTSTIPHRSFWTTRNATNSRSNWCCCYWNSETTRSAVLVAKTVRADRIAGRVQSAPADQIVGLVQNAPADQIVERVQSAPVDRIVERVRTELVGQIVAAGLDAVRLFRVDATQSAAPVAKWLQAQPVAPFVLHRGCDLCVA